MAQLVRAPVSLAGSSGIESQCVQKFPCWNSCFLCVPHILTKRLRIESSVTYTLPRACFSCGIIYIYSFTWALRNIVYCPLHVVLSVISQTTFSIKEGTRYIGPSFCQILFLRPDGLLRTTNQLNHSYRKADRNLYYCFGSSTKQTR